LNSQIETIECDFDSDCEDGLVSTRDECAADNKCSNRRITACIDNDNYCPNGCNSDTDNDCDLPAVEECGNDCDIQTVIICENDMDCLINAAVSCTLAKTTHTVTNAFIDVPYTSTTDYEIIGPEGDMCVLTFVITKMVSDDQIQENILKGFFENKKAICKFATNNDLVESLLAAKILPPTDIGVPQAADCSGPLYGS